MSSAIERVTGLSWKDQGLALLVSFGHAGTHWIIMTFYLILPFVRTDLGLTYTEAAFLVSVVHISSTSANFGSGLVVDVTGRKVIFLIISLIIGGCAFTIFSFGPGYPVMVALVVLIGASSNLWHPAAIAYLSHRYPAKKGYALSLHVTGASVADSLAPLLAGSLISWIAWQGAVLFGALPAFIGAGLIALILLRGDTKAVTGRQTMGFRQYLEGIRQLVTKRAVIALCVMSGFRNMTINGLYLFLPLYLADVLEFSPLLMGATMTALQLGAVIGTPIAGVASDRMSRRAIMIVVLTISTTALVAMIFVESNVLFVTAVAAVGFLLFSIRPVIQSWMMDLTPPGVGASAMSLLFGTQSAFSATAPIIGGIIADNWGLHPVFFMLAGTILIANLLVFALPRRDARRV
ncbi:MAG: MFS transporter [Rhodospirillales bacterium]|jgi:MFS family permease|nr:MFS transporter [Rhodospirillales bacterium]